MTKCAENVTGLKLSTEDTNFSPIYRRGVVEEHFLCCEVISRGMVERKEERMLV